MISMFAVMGQTQYFNSWLHPRGLNCQHGAKKPYNIVFPRKVEISIGNAVGAWNHSGKAQRDAYAIASGLQLEAPSLVSWPESWNGSSTIARNELFQKGLDQGDD